MGGDAMELVVTSSLGAMGPALRLLADKGSLPKELENNKDLEDLNNGLKHAHSYIDKVSKGEEQPSFADRYWMKEMRELSYDVEDCLMGVVPRSSSGSGSLQVLRMLSSCRRKRRPLVASEISHLKQRLEEADERHKRYNQLPEPAGLPDDPAQSSKHGSCSHFAGNPAAARDRYTHCCSFVGGKNEPMEKLIVDKLAFDKEPQLKVLAVPGSQGVGKTCLARRLFHRYGERFQCRAFLRVSRKPNTYRLLTSMLSQIKGPPQPQAPGDPESLVDNINRHLRGKSYFIIVDELWDASVWDVIRRALPGGNCYSRIITTTQIEDAELACSEDELLSCSNWESLENDIKKMYNALCPHWKTCLLYLRMYPEDYVIRKDDLVKQWVAEGFLGVNDSTDSHGSGESQQTEQNEESLRSVIGDREVAAGLCFDALVERKMLQPVDINYSGEVLSCTVPHTVLDYIAQESMEANFVHVVDYRETVTGLLDKVRRLSVRFGGAKNAQVPTNLTVSHVRSVLFSGFFKCVPSLAEYWLLRVLILDIWSDKGEIVDLAMIGELFQLRYVKIESNMPIKLPAMIRQLEYLQTLDVAAQVAAFPSDIYCLKNLQHLRLPSKPHLSLSLIPSLLNITSYSHLLSMLLSRVAGFIPQIENTVTSDIDSWDHSSLIFDKAGPVHLRSVRNFNLSTCSSSSMTELGNQKNLQDLHLTCSAVPSSRQADNIKRLVTNLCKSNHLKCLILYGEVSSSTTISCDGGEVSSSTTISCDSLHSASSTPALERLELSPRVLIMSSLPTWVGCLNNLITLKVAVKKLSNHDVYILQKLAALASLSLDVRTTHDGIIFNEEGFKDLKYFKFTCTALCVEFTEGAMPSVQKLKLAFNAHTMQQYMPQSAGIEYLAGLKVISAKIGGAKTDEANREGVKRKLLDAFIRNYRLRGAQEELPIINFQMVDWNIHGDKEQSSADGNRSGGLNEHFIIEENDTTEEDNNNVADSRISTWEPSLFMQKPGWVSRRTRTNGVRLVKTVRGLTYVIRRHVKHAGFRLTNEVASLHQDLEWLTATFTDTSPGSQPQEWALQVQDLAYDIQDFVDIYRWLRTRSRRHTLAHVSHIVQLKDMIRNLRERQHGGGPGIGAAPSRGLPPYHHVPEDRLVGFEKPMREILELVLLHSEFEKAKEQLSPFRKTAEQRPSSSSPTEVLMKPRPLKSYEGDIIVDESPAPVDEENKLRVVSIVGFRGIGKTALARAAYDLVSTMLNPSDCTALFQHVAWVVASDCSHGYDLLTKMCQQVKEQADNSAPDFYMLKEILRNKRFLVVIDDLQEAGVWYDIQSAFPEAHTGSRVIVTTSIGSVAAACSPERYIYRMRGLCYSDAEKLFWERVERRKTRAPSLVYALEDTFRKCGGLPMALVSAANNLCREGENLLPGVPGAFEAMNRVLIQCYESLPDNGHRMCLLSLSTFPQGHLIRRKRLVRRWMAEGLAVGDGKLSAEQVAGDRFDKLIDRNIVEPVLIGNNSKVKGCQVLGVIKDFIVNKSVLEEFGALIQNDRILLPNKKGAHPVRRLSVHGGTAHCEKVAKGIGLDRIRLLTICNTVPFDFQECRLLRVLDLEWCQGVDKRILRMICRLVFLKYLSLRGSDVYKISKKIKKLECLETLDIRETRVESLPIEVLMLPRLVYLFGRFELPGQLKDEATRSKLLAFFSEKSRLHTLSGFVMAENNGFEPIMLRMRSLRKVKIWCKHPVTTYTGHLLASSLQKRLAGSNALESISIDFGNESINFLNSMGAPCALTGSIKLWGRLESLPSFMTSHDTTLSELQLSWTGLTIEALSVLQNLRRLLYLKLVEYGEGFFGERFVVQNGGFPSLLRLCLEAPKLPQIYICKGGMSSLTSLHLLCPEFASSSNNFKEIEHHHASSSNKFKGIEHPHASSSNKFKGIEHLDASSINNFKGIEHLQHLNELLLHPSVSLEILNAWKEEARSHINKPKVTRQSASMLSVNRGSLGTTKDFRVHTSDPHVPVTTVQEGEILIEIPDKSAPPAKQSKEISGGNVPPPAKSSEEIRVGNVHPMLQLRRYILLLASVVAMVTYAVGFSPPGGVWKDTVAGHLAGDPIIRDTHYSRYLVFFYCNATAFFASLVVIVLLLFVDNLDGKDMCSSSSRIICKYGVRPLQAAMVVGVLCLMGAHAAGSYQNRFATIYSSVLVSTVFIQLVINMILAYFEGHENLVHGGRKLVDVLGRKVLMIFATFAVSTTYRAGLSTPGGTWDTAGAGHSAGDAILKDRHNARLKAFLGFNTTAFIASLFIIILALTGGRFRKTDAYACILVYQLPGLAGAYIAGSCRQTGTTLYVVISLAVVVPLWILLVLRTTTQDIRREEQPADDIEEEASTPHQSTHEKEQARSLVLLLATLAATVTYLAGLHPPGGVWQDSSDGHKAGDPILLTTNPRRYKAFFYCNSVCFVACLLAIVTVRTKKLALGNHVVKAAMMFGLMGAYVAGSSRDLRTSVLTLSMATGVIVFYVVNLVVVFFISREGTHNEQRMEKTVNGRFILFAIFVATITYQAGLTPPGGFLIQDHGQSGHHAGDPVLSHNFPVFFYCNSVSFMLSIWFLVHCLALHRSATRYIRHAYTAAAALLFGGLIGAYAAGSTQHLKTSIYVFVLAALVLFFVGLRFIIYLITGGTATTQQETNTQASKKTTHAAGRYSMLLGILVASATYQAGLQPPGGVWQSSSGGFEAGNPVMHDERRQRYLAFFYSNSTSFVASIVVILLLLLPVNRFGNYRTRWIRRRPALINTTILLDLLGLLGAYAAGSTREFREFAFVILILAVFYLFLFNPRKITHIARRIRI